MTRSTAAAALCLAVALLPDRASAQGAPRAEARTRPDLKLLATRATMPIRVDGVLDEADWARAGAATGFVQSEPREGEPATEETEVRVMYDDENLYFGIFAHDHDPHGIIVNDLREDFAGGIANSSTDMDLIELVLDTFGDKRNGYQFVVNPAGAKADAQMANEGRETNWSWDGIWTTGARIADQGWYAEIAIPFKTLKFAEGDQPWGVNFHRRVRRINEDSYWSPLPRIFNISRVSMAGTLDGVRGLQPGRDLRIKPYALGSFAQTSSRRSGDGNGGFDVKYGVTSGLMWDFTLRTDFAQVEADEQQINLSRFSLFFPEKRDFFLENSGVFGFGIAQQGNGGAGGAGGGRQDSAARNDVLLFYSRQIGLSPTGDAIPISAGTRLSGRVGQYSIGALNIQQEAQGTTPGTNFTAIRLRRDILANSDIGAMFLNKDASGSDYNRVLGVDGNFRFFQNLNVNANITRTFAPEASLRPGGSATMFNARSSYRGRVWEFRGSYGTVGERFRDDMGYVPRIGITKTAAFVAPHLRFERWSSWLRETFPHWEYSNVTRADGGLDSRYYDYHFPWSFQNGGNVELGLNRSIEGPAVPFKVNARSGITIPAGQYAFNEYFASVRSNPSARLSGNARWGLGNFYDGYKHSYDAGLTTRFNEQLNVTATYSRNVVSLPAGAFTTNLLGSRVVYGFSTHMFVNALLQYNTDAQLWTSNIRFNLIHHPLSDFFVVYNEGHDTSTNALSSRAVIVKLTQMMAF